MAVSTDERREVAARLRVLADENAVTATNYLIREIFKVLGGEPPATPSICTLGNLEAYDQAFLYRLADLIEPEGRTCCKELMIHFCPATELTPEREYEFFGCSWCGEYLSDTDCYGLYDAPNYCSNCGRKVDKSFVIDESTGEVIYRDGAKVMDE